MKKSKKTAEAIRKRPKKIANHILTEDGFFVNPDFISLSEEDKKKICNGVGGAKGISKIAPDTIWGLNVKKSADIHDYDYHVGGTKEDKLRADVAFYWNLQKQISEGCFLLKPLRMRRAKAYFWAVRACGRFHFNFHKKG